MNVAHKCRAAPRDYLQTLFRFVTEKLSGKLSVSNPVDANVNHGRAPFDMLAANKTGSSDSRYENVRLPGD